MLLRADSAFYGHPTIAAAIRGGAHVSVTVRMDPKVKAAIAGIDDDAWTPIEYTDAVYDESTGRWISRAEVAEIAVHRVQLPQGGRAGRGPAGRAPHPRPQRPDRPGQATLFDVWRFHAFFTTTDLDTVTADTTHRGHAIIEQVHADLKNSALAHLPSGKFTANSRLAGAGRDGVQPHPRRGHPRPATGWPKPAPRTIRRTLITVPARIASSARRLTLHLPTAWPWRAAWTTLFTRTLRPAPPGHTLTAAATARPEPGEPDTQVGKSTTPPAMQTLTKTINAHDRTASVDRG